MYYGYLQAPGEILTRRIPLKSTFPKFATRSPLVIDSRDNQLMRLCLVTH